MILVALVVLRLVLVEQGGTSLLDLGKFLGATKSALTVKARLRPQTAMGIAPIQKAALPDLIFVNSSRTNFPDFPRVARASSCFVLPIAAERSSRDSRNGL